MGGGGGLPVWGSRIQLVRGGELFKNKDQFGTGGAIKRGKKKKNARGSDSNERRGGWVV